MTMYVVGQYDCGMLMANSCSTSMWSGRTFHPIGVHVSNINSL